MHLLTHPVKRRRLYEGIVEQLETLILSGALQPGEQLPSERGLMTTFEVGRTAVREALFTLQRRGLVALQSGERANVTLPTSRAVVDELATIVRFHLASQVGACEFAGARMLFETGLVRLAAETATEADLVSLRALLAANHAALSSPEAPEAFIDTDVAFHFGLAKTSRNSIFTALHSALSEWLRQQRASSVTVAGSPEAAYAAHCRILDAVETRDADGAAREMRAHLEQVAEYMRQADVGG